MDSFEDFNNPQVKALPKHLRQYIVPQHYEHYTPIDQAIWRYVMRQNYRYLKDVAYYPYIPGLKKAGLTIERIPKLQEMNDALAKIGWGAVTVDGFIPPAAFMEYQAHRVLVIAADIRQLKHIEYTPAPDIIHESAGHAPIIADIDYNQYLSYFGSIGAKAMYSAQDYELYESIRALSILKEMPDADPIEIKAAEEQVAHRQQNMGDPSEMALLSRLHWWTVEYGLIGPLENPKIYGAGLLSSIGESATCMQHEVKKLLYNVDALNYSYDITQPQRQLFVTETFQNLIEVLEQFANTMAFRIGGTYGLQKAIESNNTCTIVYSSGLQVSGTLTNYKQHNGIPSFINITGPASISLDNKQLVGHDKDYHKSGYSSPVGKLICEKVPLEYQAIDIGKLLVLHFESGIILVGTVIDVLRQNYKNIMISFEECSVIDKNGLCLFEPSWGVYDMAVGEHIISVFGGAADKDEFEETAYHPQTTTYRASCTDEQKNLQQLYQQVRNSREINQTEQNLLEIWGILKNNYPQDWLCTLEILEIYYNQEILIYLTEMAKNEPNLRNLIHDGLALLEFEDNSHAVLG